METAGNGRDREQRGAEQSRGAADLLARGALLRVVLLVAGHAHDVHVARDEALVADRLLALEAQEARLVPLLALVLELLHAGLEHLLASVRTSTLHIAHEHEHEHANEHEQYSMHRASTVALERVGFLVSISCAFNLCL